MQQFQYKGIDSRGKNVSGRLVANDEPNLEEKLRGQGIWLIDAKPDAEEPKKAVRASQRKGAVATGGSRRELINFCTLMSFLCKVGIPVVQAVDIAAQDTDHEGFRATLTEMKRDVEGGQQLAEAMERHPGVFQKQFVNLIRAGEQSGSIPESFVELKRYLEWQEQVAADVKQATIYPAFVLLATVLFVLLLFTFVIPKFVVLLKSVKVALPLPTRIVFGLSDFAKATWWGWLVLLIGGPLVVHFGCKYSPAFNRLFDRFKMLLPVMGPLLHMIYMSRLARSLAVLYRNGVAILNALKLCEGLVGSPIVAEALQDVGKRVEAGESLSESMRRHKIFPQLLLRMVVMGEKTGNLDAALDNVAEYYNLLIPRKIKKLFGIMEPAMILTLVGVVGMVALAVFMPILSLMENIK